MDALAGSIASVIAMAGDIITMPSNAMMMIHNPYMGMVGNAAEFRSSDYLDKITESIVSTYLRKQETNWMTRLYASCWMKKPGLLLMKL
ncbi:ATP-dependent Clp protease proteolytic subunit (plasmid) [Bacillus paralicheniformis]